MIRKAIIERLKRNNQPVWTWKDCNDLWNDLKHRYGTSEEEFMMEIHRLVEEGKLIKIHPNDRNSNYQLSEDFMLFLGIEKVYA